ncbi:MAG TPA: histidine kinase dimerization/phospho-acceptor domain-containing protein [Gemmatimonadaceae bacterium]|nr:histidine kinase dimerization/phospho-acceptor domain-containing protein [Gemmatimonadaceae bacterium]
MARDPDSPAGEKPVDSPAARAPDSNVSELRQTLAGLAHELNNPLAAIMGFAQLLLKRPWPAEDRAALEMINNEAIRSAAIVHNLLVLSGRRIASTGVVRALDVLVASADAATLARIESFLSSRGHAVITAASSDMALKLAAHTPFDVVVCDEAMLTRQGASLGIALRETRGCVRARFVTTIPRALQPAMPGVESADTPQVDVEALRRVVEGD